jgi:alanine racemase
MLASQQTSLTSLRRDAWVEVDLGALEGNVKVIKSWLNKNARLMAVVKSDAYGHGAPGTAAVLAASGADWFGVASVDEGCQLRGAGAKEPILILGPSPFWAISTALDADLNLTITSPSQVGDIKSAAEQSNKIAKVHVKVDTGMHRLGVSPDKLGDLLSSIYASPSFELAGIFSHLAKADDKEFTDFQNEKFKAVLNSLPPGRSKPALVHLASGEAARRFPETHYDMARVGLYLYGLEPLVVSDVVSPILSVRARINHIQEISGGESVGYGLTWRADRPTRLASIPIGYADGVDRGLSNRMEALFMGKRIKQVGRISMDQMLFDITDVSQAQQGDVITLIGTDAVANSSKEDRLHLADWAAMLDTITYELACRLRVRLPRIYTRSRSLR